MSLLLKQIKVISRSSNLAIKQVEEVFKHYPEIDFSINTMNSFGDNHKEISLLENNDSDFFTRELDMALLNNEADIAIHSAKDLPYPLPKGLEVISLFESSDKTDSLVCSGHFKLKHLKTHAKIGTSSLSRKNELLKLRSDIEIVSVRGTIEERIGLVDSGELDAVIVATCALKRLNIQHRISEILPFKTHPLQGNIAIVSKSNHEKLKVIFSKKDIRKKYGTVSLVGFGPGDPELLTIKAYKALAIADIIYYDDLISKDFINRFNAEKIYVGKRKNKHSKEQDEINQLLYQSAIQGKNVVRLKGGDPMIFAHGGEENVFLEQYLVKTEVVSGISSGIAASALCKIPLTLRDISSSITFISGHNMKNISIPESGTLVFYMSVSTINSIAEKLIQKRWHLNTPVAIIYNVSNPDQEEIILTLEQILNSNSIYKTPSIIIVGDVVNVKTKNIQQLIKPTILVTGTDSSAFSHLRNVIHQPLINIVPYSDYTHFYEVLKNSSNYNWIVFTSIHTVQFFFSLLKEINKDARFLFSLRVVSIGMQTSLELNRNGIIPDIQAKEETSNGLLKIFCEQNHLPQNILLPRSDKALNIIPDGLIAKGHSVTPLILYKNEFNSSAEIIDLNKINYVSFSSPSCVDNFFSIYNDYPDSILFIAKGETTKARMIEQNIHPSKIILQYDFIKIYTNA